MDLIKRLKDFLTRESAFDRLEQEMKEEFEEKVAILDAKNALIKDHGKTCKICRYSQAVKFAPTHELLECRFHPPICQPADQYGPNRGAFPIVEVKDWCGNWKVRDPRPYELPEKYR